MIHLRKIKLTDLEAYRDWQLPHHAYHETNGPYFEKDNKENIDKLISDVKSRLLHKEEVFPHKKMISNVEDNLIGEVSWYWKSEETNWMEIGIVIFDPKFWNKGIGKEALKLWINELFEDKKEIVRLGLTTWSGNKGMLKLAESLGMKKEAVYRNARIVKGEYFDSVSYGILRGEWEELNYNNY